MADNGFRTFRRDARDADVAPHDGGSDPLAELARLIGQTDGAPRSPEPAHANGYDEAAASELDWAATDDGYADQAHEDESYNHRQNGAWRQDADHRDDLRDGGQYSDPAPFPAFNDAREEPRRSPPMFDARDRDEPPPAASRSQPAPYFPPAPDRHAAGDQPPYGEQPRPYADEDYDEEPAPRRSGTIAIAAVLGLAVLGTAGAVGYRAMFGGSVLPSLPPIIKPAEGPIRIAPNPQAGGQTLADASRGAGEQLVPHQEQPVDIPPPNPTPRVIQTIPVISSSPNGAVGAAPVPVPPPPVQPPVVQPPAFAPPPAAGPPNGGPDQLAAPNGAPPAGPHKVHTVTIRQGQGQPAGANPAAVPPPRQVKPTRDASAGGPLSIVPGQDGGVQQPVRERTAMAARPAPLPLGGEPGAAGGGAYTVQVSSQRSEGEAQAAYRSLQAKFPQQLGGRHALIRRADLGDKGIYYRALVGPFASAEQAAGLCSSLKAAGANCIIQRN